ncbi:MAG: hypothetical protein CO094_10425 [Anaerolineae bacterium CG_4_9_14_3_um_filter_57_17]|nr:hypothetical protein [bacterium]NCT20848.1 hypothetical protein [bacterium]OIO84438.1 MAG: hypothetical protein AUK01_09475 [Anaerolineae bacterium CG2_30_57_67]PJB65220.1 MAG: hypothetical protein CO094_10425 [Anaerolineae bacterium CG_4_9_14_3_um_filter_57_17]
MKKTIVMIIVLLAASLACSLFTASAPSAPAQSANILFQDNFSSTSSGWDQASGDNGSTDYANGAYRIYVSSTQYDAWANPGKSFDADVSVEVDVTKTAGPENNDMGVICRYNTVNGNFNFYYFIISSDGFAMIAKMVDSSSSFLAEKATDPNPAIKMGNATNHLRADCVGNQLTLYVNGTQVMSVTDSELTGGGDAGLIAGTFDTAGTDALFDNFAVAKP